MSLGNLYQPLRRLIEVTLFYSGRNFYLTTLKKISIFVIQMDDKGNTEAVKRNANSVKVSAELVNLAGSKKNVLIVGLGILLLVIGFFCLAQGPAENPLSLTVAPLVLVFSYLVVVPLGILWEGKKKE
ncbi:hypothetical protein AGMMS49938_13450 [Fibrobacterales bacterium]|nr:hypothetical protein AGMMS49938_13450 [Fibrobacterales bacterium]